MGKAIIHFLEGVDDEIDRGLERGGDAIFAHQPLIDPKPIFDAIGQPLVVDDDQEIIVGFITLGGVRLVDPTATGIAAIEDDLLDAALLAPSLGGERQTVLEFLEDDLHDARQFALLVGGKMIEIVTHGIATLSDRSPDGKPSGAAG